MATAPFNLFLLHLGWSQVPASFTFSVGTQVIIGGAGIIGGGSVVDVMALGDAFATSDNPVPTAKILQGGVVGTAYSETISAQGGTAPYTFAVATGSLPAGLSLDGSTGIISGTPTTAGTSDFTVQATDAAAATGSTNFEVAIAASGGGAAKPTNYCLIN
ncbi:MAG: Ig domain-containing protein [Acidobacteriaceae bacterium]